jgi:hypothetical protein
MDTWVNERQNSSADQKMHFDEEGDMLRDGLGEFW